MSPRQRAVLLQLLLVVKETRQDDTYDTLSDAWAINFLKEALRERWESNPNGPQRSNRVIAQKLQSEREWGRVPGAEGPGAEDSQVVS